MSSPLRRSALGLENLFFLKKESILLEKQKELERMEHTRENLSRVSGIANRAVLQKLLELGVGPEELAMLAVIPLVEVAWADGEVQEEEREAVLAGAAKIGGGKGGMDYELLEGWLNRRPPPKLLDAWVHYIRGLCETLSETEKHELQETLIQRARAVAEAAGGFLGLTSKVSASEEAVLEKMEKAFESDKALK
jgi:hypothetical protein